MSAPLVDKVLREAMIETGVLDLPTFFNAVRDNNVKDVQHRMSSVDMQSMGGPNIWDEHGQYPIHIAAAEGHTKMVRMLIEMQGDVNQMTQSEHRTALHYAVINKSHSTIRYLVDVGAKTDIKDVFHRTPRMYAVDEEMMRLVFEGECINKNLSELSETIERLMKMNNIKVRKPRPEEAPRVCLGYEVFATEMDEVNARENLAMPVPPTPGKNLVQEELSKMKKRNHGHTAYLVVAPREEFSSNSSRPFSSFIKISYTDYYKGEPAVRIDDIFVSKHNRRHYWGSILLASALSYIVVGPHPPPKRIFKVFVCVNEANNLANEFFKSAGFCAQPPAAIPPRLRQLGTVVYAAQHAGLLLSKVTKAIKPGLSFASDWVTTEQIKKKEAAAVKAAEDRDMKVFNKRLDAVFAEADVPRMTKMLANVAGDVLLPLGVAEPPDMKREADRARVMRIMEKKHASYMNQGAKGKNNKEPKNTCENDRVPDQILKANGAAVLRMRDMTRWKHEIEGRKVGNSKILACPSILRDAWLDELEYDAKLALPEEWIKRKDRDTGEYVYYNKNTRKSTPTRPTQDIILESRSAVEDNSLAMKEDEDAFGENIGEKQKAAEEAAKKKIKDRRLWEREMDEVVDKALNHSESLESFIKRMEIYYPKEKADEIILKARQALTAKTKIEGADLNVEQAIGKTGFFKGARDLFKTPLEKSKDVKAAVQAHCAKEISKKMADEETAHDASANSPDRPSSAVVSAAAFGTPQRRVRAVFEAPSPDDTSTVQPRPDRKKARGLGKKVPGAEDTEEWRSRNPNMVTPSKILKSQEKKRHGAVKNYPLVGHCSDAAADWIQSAADQEQALYDADSMLEMYAPPARSSSCAQTSLPEGMVSPANEPREVDDHRVVARCGDLGFKDADTWGDLSTVIESPVAAHGGGFFGHDDPQQQHQPTGEDQLAGRESRIVPFSFADGKHRDSATRPSTGMSLASTELHSRGASRGTAAGTSRGSNLFGLDGLSRSATLQDGAGFGLEGTFGPPSSAGSEAYYKDLNLSSSQGYVPWGSHMLTQQCETSYRPSSVASDASVRGAGLSASSTPGTSSIYGLDGISRPCSRTPSRPASRETGSRPVSGSWRPEWSVPWKMGAAGGGGANRNKVDPRANSATSSSSIRERQGPSRSLYEENDHKSRPTSCMERSDPETYAAPLTERATEGTESALHLPSIRTSVGSHSGGPKEMEAIAAMAPGSPWRPHTAALKTKTLQFAGAGGFPRPHSAAVTTRDDPRDLFE